MVPAGASVCRLLARARTERAGCSFASRSGSRGQRMTEDEGESSPRIVVVGPCAAGKTTLVGNLRPKGDNIRSCSQEHSGVPELWHRYCRAQVLIYLDARLSTIARRQGRSDWTERRLQVQRQRLANARAHCDLYLPTDNLTRSQVAERVEGFLRGQGIPPKEEEGGGG